MFADKSVRVLTSCLLLDSFSTKIFQVIYKIFNFMIYFVPVEAGLVCGGVSPFMMSVRVSISAEVKVLIPLHSERIAFSARSTWGCVPSGSKNAEVFNEPTRYFSRTPHAPLTTSRCAGETTKQDIFTRLLLIV